MYVLTCASNKDKSACAKSDQSSLSAWRNFAPLAIQNVPTEDSDQPAQMCRLIWIFTEHMSEGTFSDVAAHEGEQNVRWSDCTDVQAHLALHISQNNFFSMG